MGRALVSCYSFVPLNAVKTALCSCTSHRLLLLEGVTMELLNLLVILAFVAIAYFVGGCYMYHEARKIFHDIKAHSLRLDMDYYRHANRKGTHEGR